MFKNFVSRLASTILFLSIIAGHVFAIESDVIIHEIMYNPDSSNTGGEISRQIYYSIENET